jgi:hypothetical protein
MRKALLAVVASVGIVPIIGCATGKSEVPDCVKRYTGEDCGCAPTALGLAQPVHMVNKTLAGATKGAGTGVVQGVSSFCSPVANVLYAPFGIVGGAFSGFADGVGHVPAEQSCHYNFGPSLAYAWERDYRMGTQNAKVPEHRFHSADGGDGEWNGGAYWPGGEIPAR